MFTSLIIALVWCKQLFCYTHIHRYYTFGLKDRQVGVMPKYFTAIHMCKRLKSFKLPQKTWRGVNSLPASAIIPAKNRAPEGLLNPKVQTCVFIQKLIHLINCFTVLLIAQEFDRQVSSRSKSSDHINLKWFGLSFPLDTQCSSLTRFLLCPMV